MRRLLIAALAFCGACIALYLAAYQYGAVHTVWDPLFGSGSSARVLDSSASRTIRRVTIIPDAALGAIAYACECVLALVARRRRWLVLLFIANSAALALAAIALVLLQAFAVHAWCFLCLTSAAVSLVIAAAAARPLHRLLSE